jgi:2-methylisocitrate lyase-like PEP mutase family enzyme
MSDRARQLRALIAAPDILLMPGVYDAFSAYRTQIAGFQAAFVSGSALAMMHLARPDIGLLTMSETADILRRIAERVEIALFVDADQGFGNTFAVARCVRMLEGAGASGIQIEDQLETKPATDPLSRPLVSLAVMVDKIKAAQDARQHEATMISVRTDAMTTLGVSEALDRASAYADAGADMIFVESLVEKADMERLVAQTGGQVPLLHNLLRPGDAVTDAASLQAMGYSAALFPAALPQAVGGAMDAALTALRADPRSGPAGADRIDAAAFLKR